MNTGVIITLIVCATIAVVWVSGLVASVYIRKLNREEKKHDEDDIELAD